jgi:SAM-dependent methyltransferase
LDSSVFALGSTNTDRDRARAAVAENPSWYHAIELAPGVVSPGRVDWRGYASRVLPADMSGLRAVDVGTFDGFWAFEMERRGASVTAIDVDDLADVDLPPPQRARLERDAAATDFRLGVGFRIAAGLLGSGAERVTCNVYELEPERVGGEVDFAFVGSILEHLRDPVGALERVRETLRPGGRLVAVERVSVRATLLSPRAATASFQPLVSHFTWWRPNVAALLAYVRTAGFEEVRRSGRLMRPPMTRGMRATFCGVEARRGT